MSLRWRISLAFAAGAAAMAATIGLLVYQRTASDTVARARALALQRVRIADSLFHSTGRLAFSATINDPSAPAPLRRATAHDHLASFLVQAPGRPTVWAAAPLRRHGGGIFVRASFATGEHTLAALRRSLAEIGALVTLGMALLGLLFAGRLSARLRSAARVARRIGSGEPDARIGMGGRDEVAALASAVDRMADSLHERIERERRFAGDVAHELRTPVSGLVAAASLLDHSEASRMVSDRAGRLARLVEDLLEISRLEAGVEEPQPKEVDLTQIVHSVCAERPVRVTGEAAQVRSDPRRLARVISNLVENACRHGAPPVVVEIAGRCVRVSDGGPGFSVEMLAHAKARFASGSSARTTGVGLGLAIADAQASVIGATLTLENGAAGGALVTVSLPDSHQSATSTV